MGCPVSDQELTGLHRYLHNSLSSFAISCASLQTPASRPSAAPASPLASKLEPLARSRRKRPLLSRTQSQLCGGWLSELSAMSMFRRMFGGPQGANGAGVSASSTGRTVDAIQKLGEVRGARGQA